MQYRRMGSTGLRVSEICLGTMTFGSRTEEAEAHRILDTAFDAGVTFLDTSDAYPAGAREIGGTEEIIGRWLVGRPRDQVARLQEYFAAKGQSITHAAISWVLAQDGITSAIVGASRAEQIADSLKYAEVELTAEDLEFCDQPWYQIPRPTDPAVAIR